MKKYRWQLLILFLTGLVVGTLLIMEKRGGLGETGTPQPVTGGVYTEALIGSLQRLNPLLDTNNSVDRDVDRLIFSGLVRFDSRGIPQTDLAESFGTSEDGTLFNFTLKDNLKWHDGQSITTDDVLFTIDLIRQGGESIPSDIQGLWESVEVIILDKRNIQFKLPESYAPFLDYLTFGILPKHVFGEMTLDQIAKSSINLKPVGSGPYEFSELITDGGTITGVKLSAFKKYAGTQPFIQEIVFRYYSDSQSAYQAYKDGYVQGISEITSDLIPQVLTDSNLSIYSGRLPKIGIVLLNLKDPSAPFFQDANVRKALLMGINRNTLINQFFNGQAIQANGVILPDTWAYSETTTPIGYDPAQAAFLLKQAGYIVTGDQNPVRKKDDTEFKFVLSYPDDDLHRGMAEFIAEEWKKLELNVILEPIPVDEFLSEKLEPRAFQAALVDLDLSDTPDPDPYPFWDLGQATGGQNYSQWNDRTASDSLEQARVTTDLQERMRLYHNFQAIFNEELPALPLYFPVYNYAVDSQIQGVSMGPLFDPSDRFATITQWFLVARRSSQSTTIPTGE